MNKFIIKILFSALVGILFVTACNPVEDVPTKEVGFFEYQYDYKIIVDGVEKTKQGFKRVNLSSAVFKFHENDTIADSLKLKGLRSLDILIYSKEFKKDSAFGAQIKGTSVVKITLIDSTGLDSTNYKLLPYNYVINTLASSKINKKPICLDLDMNMNMMMDTALNVMKYEYNVKGQLTKSVRVIQLNDTHYQIVTNGIYNSKFYNLYYYGQIKKE